MRVTFYGAVRTVTGSMHHLEAGGATMLLDCGLYQGRRAEFYQINRGFPFEPRSIDAVVLSHAHLDHCGNLPSLVAQGFTGPIYCTPATRDLTGLVLRDSAKVQHEDLVHLRKRGPVPEGAPLYTQGDVERAMQRVIAVPYGRPFAIGGATVTFQDAGHILGAAITTVEAEGRRLGFSGDIGRPGAVIVRDSEIPPELDALLLESTYGDRTHEPYPEGEAHLAEVVSATVARGGAVLIPSFAVGRTQDITYALHRLREAGRIPSVPTFVDSPMAVDATEIYRVHPECFDEDVRAHLVRHDPFGFKGLRYLRTPEESQTLNTMPDPFVVLATSGMAESGRILQHLVHHVGDRRSTLLFVSFQAQNTLGRRLADGVSPVRIFGEPHDVRIEVQILPSFSAHADRDELLAWVSRIPRVGKAYLVHGEESQATALAGHLSALGLAAEVPERGQVVTV